MYAVLEVVVGSKKKNKAEKRTVDVDEMKRSG